MMLEGMELRKRDSYKSWDVLQVDCHPGFHPHIHISPWGGGLYFLGSLSQDKVLPTARCVIFADRVTET
jgi:hypothetical protein